MEYQIVKELSGKNGHTFTDLVCYFGDKRFILKPLSRSKKEEAYFYVLLQEKATK